MRRIGRAALLLLIAVVLLALYAGAMALVSFVLRWDLEHALGFGLSSVVSLLVSLLVFSLRSRRRKK
ncbi:hypothetical protein ACFOY2_52350 [Nonomuraea purpurea]|uniref:Uncharacterized protein n=1 Tax=Nonomuraea purpurea TaxID=1849276 RepID=A0ABV8GSU8_9ACTN